MNAAADRLPAPDAGAREISARLSEVIVAQIAASDGWMPFDRYMQLALYAPELGYYSAGLPVFGAGGDFVTAPELGSLFARTLARQSAAVLESLGGGDILEFGGGSGALAAELLAECSRCAAPLERYRILEVSAHLRARQRAAIAARAPQWLDRVEWLDTWPTAPWRGVALGNEVLDAMPVRCFSLAQGAVFERGVAVDGGGFEGAGFAWDERPASPAFAAAVRGALDRDPAAYPDGYLGELNEQYPGWLSGLAACFGRGVAVLIDYGDARAGRYHPARSGGSLRAYYRQRVHENPFWYPGLCDLTADVDFSAVATAAASAGFDVAGFTPQAQLLLGGGLEAVFAQAWAEANDTRAQLRLAQEVKRLTLPDEMGERFRAIALTRGAVAPPPGFALRDLRDRL
ncbi:class I SAM-dependent methyltransferase [Acidihalobacter ferrooxydans]|uniref:class I SAM-dependent methyltransferase n=1 Tax=Acidihalobacter ferrooxydans TaxID=1765967 RepID=UPI001E3488C5|nr:SAM-dependent methyltransferase [Acidihalobacter ferrooxydans]